MVALTDAVPSGRFDRDSTRRKCSRIHGWLTDPERDLLYNLAHNTLGGVIVEIGSWQGKSTIALASGSKHAGRGRVYAVDPFCKSDAMKMIDGIYDVWAITQVDDTYDKFMANVAEADLWNDIVPIVAVSAEAVALYEQRHNYPIRLLFIDGCHEGSYVQKDWDLWSPRVPSGGVIAFHDAIGETYPGVGKVAEHALNSADWEVSRCDSILYGTRR